MSRTIELDEELVQKTMEETGASTDKAAVEEVLQNYLKIRAQMDIFDLFGKVEWQGNLEESRLGRGID